MKKTSTMANPQLDTELQSILRSVGWSFGRQIDTKDWIAELSSRGFKILDIGVATLNEFGGIHYSNKVGSSDLQLIDLMFDPLGTPIESVLYWETQTNLTLFPIGEVDGQAELLIDESGAWYLSMAGLWKIGNCANQALNYLILGKGKSVTVCRPK